MSKVEKNDSGKFCKFKLFGVKIVPSLKLKGTNTYNS